MVTEPRSGLPPVKMTTVCLSDFNSLKLGEQRLSSQFEAEASMPLSKARQLPPTWDLRSEEIKELGDDIFENPWQNA